LYLLKKVKLLGDHKMMFILYHVVKAQRRVEAQFYSFFNFGAS
jgi:hypothetical protein